MSIRSKIATRLGPLMGFFEKEPVGIVRIDGGFSSQLLRYAIGYKLSSQGYDIEYDLTFFEDVGKSIDGKDDRIFRLKECFPYLEIKEAEKDKVERYKKFYDCDLNKKALKLIRGEMIKMPFYVSGMTALTGIAGDYKKIFDFSSIQRLMSEEAKESYRTILEKKKENTIVGVHVRRGDMTATGHYWKVLTGNYFIKIINRIKNERTFFVFFSEDFEWVRSNILSGIDVPYLLVDQKNKEYIDFYLYSLCDILVASQSSWGKRAMFFNDNEKRKLILPEKEGTDITAMEELYGVNRVEIEKLSPDMYES